MIRTFVTAAILMTASAARADAPEPSGQHPRILLDDKLRAAWKEQIKVKDSAVARSIARCDETRANFKEWDDDVYMGFDWSASAAACLIAWAARNSDADAKQALVYVAALIDDLGEVGDKKGGEKSVRRDTGYATRSVPIYPAIAYDWLYSHPAMTPALKQRIRERLDTWMSWAKDNAYHSRVPGNNYHAGYLWAATLTAVALGGENDAFITKFWKHVRDEAWGSDMAKVLAPGGLFDGGDFPEGWQYAPLSVAEYAVAARIMEQHGVKIEGVDRWLAAMFTRTMHARSGARDDIAVLADTEAQTPSIQIQPLTYWAIMAGNAPEAAQQQAAGELQRLKLDPDKWFFFEALAQGRNIKPMSPGLDKWPTAYYAPGTANFYARTSWAKSNVWMWTSCLHTPHMDYDHVTASAGNITVTRGVDEVLVDPTFYGSSSTLTTNAPTLDSKQLDTDYRPSQAVWGETTHFVWAQQTGRGVIATRCDYADQYKFQETKSDIPFALRDIVLIPWGKERADASVVIVDRGETAGPDYKLYLRFRSPGTFKLTGDVATTKVGASTFAVHKIIGAAAPGVRTVPKGDCWTAPRGKCEAPRFPIGEYRIEIPGPKPEAIHVLDISGGDKLTTATIVPGVTHLKRGAQDAYVASGATSYSVTPSADATHVVLTDSPTAKLTTSKEGDKCKVDVTTDGPARPVGPFVFVLDIECKLAEDLKTGPATPDLAGSSVPVPIAVGGPTQSKKGRGGCCGASGGSPASSMMLGVVVLGLTRRRRR